MPGSPLDAKHTSKAYNHAEAHKTIDGKQSGKPALSQYEEQQNDEIEVLRSVFPEDFTENETREAWSRKAEKSFQVALHAALDPSFQVVLTVTFTATYPKSEPILGLRGDEELGPKVAAKLRDLILRRPKELLGEVMILDLVNEIRDLLEDAAEAHRSGKALPSLEQERALEEARAERQMRAAQDEVDKKRQVEKAEEERMMQQMVEDEAKRRESLRKKRESHDVTAVVKQSYNANDVVFDQETILEQFSSHRSSFRVVTLVREIGRGPLTSVFEARVKQTPSGGHASYDKVKTSTCLALKRVKLSSKGAKKTILDIEDELDKLKALRHDNAINLLNFKISRVDDSWHFDLLTDLGNTMSLADLLDTVERLPVQRARTFGIDILQALDFFHKNAVTHGDLHLGNLLLGKSETGNTTLKLSDTSFQLHLHALYAGTQNKTCVTTAPTAWLPPECSSQEYFAKSRKTDIFEFGRVLAQMVVGADLMDRYATVSMFIANAGLTLPFQDLMRDLLRSDPRKRIGAFDAIPYEFFRVDCGAFVESQARRITGVGSRRRSFHNHSSLDDATELPSASRYATEWDELGRLGRGGFGEVIKARNKLDGRIYAMKKISGKTPTQLSEVLSEVYLLATLNHPYVVRYYTAWPETETSITADSESSPGTSSRSNRLQADLSTKDNSESLFAYGQSTGGIDFISSSGYPRNDGESEEDEEDEEDISKGSEDGVDDIFERSGTQLSFPDIKSSAEPATMPLTRTRSLVRATLHIQMEFCEKLTLRDIIRRGVHENADEVWRLLRQILEGLVHIHGHGIIHRDLKPENIFVDNANNAKIGDFGLATTGNLQVSEQDTGAKILSSEMTRSIGTALYVAPELRSTATGSYTAQVDMYSLGIILFEMCYPLRTAMERIQTLSAMRTKDHALPQDFQSSSIKRAQGDIIESLVKHKPSERPSSIELLRGGMLPIQIEDEQIRHALSTLSDTSSPYYHRMMAALFAQNANREVMDRMWDKDVSHLASTDATEYLLLRGVVKSRLLSIFRRYGAIEVPRSGLLPKSDHYSRNDVVQLLDPSGTLLQLPYDLVLPHARYIAKQDHVPERSFTFGTVFREPPSGGAPRSNREADFDIVTYSSKDLALAEAEVIKCLDDILSDLPCFTKTAMCFHISHSGILDLILDFCRVSSSQRQATKEVLGKLNIGPWTWQKIRTELRSPAIGVASTSLDDLAQFDFRDTPEKAFSRLQSIFTGTSYLPKVQAIFVHISGLFEYLGRFEVRRSAYFCPLSNFNVMFYRDAVMFQCLFDTKKRDIVAAGGRYDSLIEDHRPQVSSTGYRPNLHSVGASIAWDRFVTAMARFQRQSGTAFLKTSEEPENGGQWAARRCDALVASFDSNLLRSVGVKLVSKLRGQDISAELAIDARAPEELLAHYRGDRHRWIIIVKHEADPNSKPELKIRNMDKKGESTDIRSSELMSYMRAEIRERDQRDGTNDRAKLLRHTSSHGEDKAYNVERKGDVRVLLARQGNKPGNKKPYKARVVEGAQLRVKELLASYTDGPIASIETKDEILSRIRETRLSDPESWKRLDQEVPVADRPYLHELRDLLEKFKIQYGETRKAFIYNFKTNMCIDYDLWL